MPCPDCEGKGYVEREVASARLLGFQVVRCVACPRCEGRRTIEDELAVARMVGEGGKALEDD